MNGKIKRIKEQLGKAQKSLVRNEAWFFWQEELEKAITYPSLEEKKCNSCSTVLEEEDRLNKTFRRTRQSHTFDYECRFCGALV